MGVMPDTTDTHMLMDMLTTESALLMPSPRLMLTLTFCTEDMDMDTLDIVDITDTHTDTDTMENALLMLNPKLMLSLIIMADMDMDILDTVDIMDTHTDTDTME